ncbi:hypothetical protein, partial [Streptomyces sp. NPDC056308]|uniref:hypothetical protein n=1 Tax=Streptomyces sp. NPDC056308 TaxID=3345780 RepID=UPI0035D933C3
EDARRAADAATDVVRDPGDCSGPFVGPTRPDPARSAHRPGVRPCGCLRSFPASHPADAGQETVSGVGGPFVAGQG